VKENVIFFFASDIIFISKSVRLAEVEKKKIGYFRTFRDMSAHTRHYLLPLGACRFASERKAGMIVNNEALLYG